MKHYEDLFPSPFENTIKSYSEPFFGGGAMLLNVTKRFPRLQKLHINDINSGLVGIYRNVKDNVVTLTSRSMSKLIRIVTRFCSYSGITDTRT